MLRARTPLLMLCLLLPVGCGKVQSTINPSDANLFNKEWDAMIAMGGKSPHVSELPLDATLLLFEGLEALDEKLEAGPLGALADREIPTTRSELAQWLQSLAPLLVDITDLLNREPIKRAIMSGQSLAQRPSLNLELEPRDRYATPALARSMRLIRPLCANAVFCAFSPQGSDDCVRNLVQALDLIHLLDDGSLRSLGITSSLGSEVLKALQQLLPRSNVSPEFLRSQIEPRLVLATGAKQLERTLQEEAMYRMALGRSVVLKPESPANAFGLKYLNCSAPQAIARCMEFQALNKTIVAQANICGPVAQESARGTLPRDIRIIKEFHNYATANHMARLAIALSEFRAMTNDWPKFLGDLEGFTGGTPTSPCSARRIDYKVDFNGVRLVSFDRISSTKEPDTPLHSWTWSKQDLAEFNAGR